MASRPSSNDSLDPHRPADHFDSAVSDPLDPGIAQPRLGLIGYLRFFWRQLTSMRTALFLLLLVALAAVPGSLVPQTTSDPNGVIQFKAANPAWWVGTLDFLGVFNTYSSVWFSAIYILLFISLIGCIVPRTKHHWDALRAAPPKTPARLERLDGFRATENAPIGDAPTAGTGGAAGSATTAVAGIAAANQQLRRLGYRTRVFEGASVSAERGYLRETGNLIFHMALVGILFVVGFGGGFIWTGQRVVIAGKSFANTLSNYDSISPGRWFSSDSLTPYRLTLDKLSVTYAHDLQNPAAYGSPIDYTAYVTTEQPGQKTQKQTIKVNSPLRVGGTDVYLLGNGYAPVITVRNAQGVVKFTGPVPFLTQDANLTSLGVVKLPTGFAKQIGLVGLFLPTACTETSVLQSEGLSCGAQTQSTHPDLLNPVLTFQTFTGDLGLDKGKPVNAFSLDTSKLTQVGGRGSGKIGITLTPGTTAQLPDGLGSITMGKTVLRYASLDIHHDPTQFWVLGFAILVFAGLITGLFVPRRRVWVKAVQTEAGIHYEYAGLARGEDPRLKDAVAEIARKHSQRLGLTMKP